MDTDSVQGSRGGYRGSFIGTPVEHRNMSGTQVEHEWNTSGTPEEQGGGKSEAWAAGSFVIRI